MRPRLPRVERETEIKVQEDENQHLWAVSYADFLMALLAFFILFFSMDEPQREDLINSIAVQFEKSGTRNPAEVPGGFDPVMFEKVKALDVKLVANGRHLTVQFPDNYFAPGKYKIEQAQQASLNRVFETLKPYASKVDIYFEGHSDDSPVHHSKTAQLTDNFDLSGLRASNALRYAEKMGFEEKHLFMSAMASNARSSRTISLRLVAREGTL